MITLCCRVLSAFWFQDLSSWQHNAPTSTIGSVGVQSTNYSTHFFMSWQRLMYIRWLRRVCSPAFLWLDGCSCHCLTESEVRVANSISRPIQCPTRCLSMYCISFPPHFWQICNKLLIIMNLVTIFLFKDIYFNFWWKILKFVIVSKICTGNTGFLNGYLLVHFETADLFALLNTDMI